MNDLKNQSPVLKKILLIWDFDGIIGQINATRPYRMVVPEVIKELEQVEWLLDYLNQTQVKCCFAITGFSAEKDGWYPYNFPELVKRIYDAGHEIASHSWKHEWVPTLNSFQFNGTLKRSKQSLERATEVENSVNGFVPPHNKPSSWIRRGAFSLEDRYLFPFYKFGELGNVFKVVAENGYRWMRVSYNPLYQRLGFGKRLPAGRVRQYKELLLLENQYIGFDKGIRQYIEKTSLPTYTVSAHPLMLSFQDKRSESKANFIQFIEQFSGREDVRFVTPSTLL